MHTWLKLSKHRLPHAYLPPFICKFNRNNLIWQVESSFLTTNISPPMHILKLSVKDCRLFSHRFSLPWWPSPFYGEVGLFPSSGSYLFSSDNGHFCPVPFPSTEPVPTGGRFKGCSCSAVIKQGTLPVPQKQSSSVGVCCLWWVQLENLWRLPFCVPWEDAVWAVLHPEHLTGLQKNPPHESYSWQAIRVLPASQSNSSLIFIKFRN